MQEAGGSLGSSGTLDALDARDCALHCIEAVSELDAAVPWCIVRKASQQQGAKCEAKPRHARSQTVCFLDKMVR